MKTMMAVRIHQFGDPNVLVYEPAPKPIPQSDEILIRIHAAAVNPLDCKIRSGKHPLSPQMQFPGILGWDLSGVVESVGNAVTRFKIGDEVYARPGNYSVQGAYAEYQAVKENVAAIKPNMITHVEAASLPLVGLTCWQALIDTAQLKKNQKILIHAAAGGCGSFAVQLAKVCGAYVIGTSSAVNIDFLKSLGADVCIDYNKTRFEEVVNDVDVVFDLVGAETQERSWRILRKDGILVSIVRPEPNPAMMQKYHVRGKLVVMHPNGKQLESIAALVNDKKIKPIVSKVLSLQETPLAQCSHKSEIVPTAIKFG